MRYHDFQLERYSVSDFGKKITLQLVFDYPNHPKESSTIEFTDVIAHNFIHADRAIIVDIIQTKPSEISKELEEDLLKWADSYSSLRHDENMDSWKSKLENDGYKIWTIYSAIGFSGVIVAKEAK